MSESVQQSLKDRKVAKCEKWFSRSRKSRSAVADAIFRLEESIRDTCAARGIFVPAMG